jgi:hypothetical protein
MKEYVMIQLFEEGGLKCPRKTAPVNLAFSRTAALLVFQ